MNVTRACVTTLTLASLAIIVAGCAGPPKPLPVHAEVEWESHAVGTMDDERVAVVREFLVQLHAAANALNYSDPALTEIDATGGYFAESAVDNLDWDRSISLWEGPPSFSVIDIVKPSNINPDTDDPVFDVRLCQRPAPRWTLEPGVFDGYYWEPPAVAPGTKVEAKGFAYRVTRTRFTEVHYTVRKLKGHWRVTRIGSEDRCDPGEDVTVGTYATQPDIDLLLEADENMVVDEDDFDERGRRVTE